MTLIENNENRQNINKNCKTYKNKTNISRKIPETTSQNKLTQHHMEVFP